MARYLRITSSLCAVLALVPTAAKAFDEVVALDPEAGELPESVTLDADGTVYVSVGNTVRRLTDGALEVFGTLSEPGFALGVKVGRDGCVYTASTSLDPSAPGAFVWRICEEGSVEKFATLDPAGGANDLAFDDEDFLYVTDPLLGRIWRVDPEGDATIWLDDPALDGNPAAPVLGFALGVDGIAFDKKQKFLYVSNLDFGQILRIRLQANGDPGALSVFASDASLKGADGIAFDKKGQLLVAVGAEDSIATVDKDGDVAVLAAGGLLDGPSSVAFGTSQQDKRTLYVTNLAFSRANGLKPGTPNPALLSRDVGSKGLPLP